MIQLLTLQFLSHLLSDFFLQSNKSCKEKADKAFRSKSLYVHVLITFVFAWILSAQLQFWWAALLISVMHLVIDGLKSKFQQYPISFFIDQLLHWGVIAGVVWLYDRFGNNTLPQWIPSQDIMLWVVAFVFCLSPANFFIQATFKLAGIRMPDNKDTASSTPPILTPKQENKSDLTNAGRVIGNAERILTLIFIALNEFEAIGFLLAAKSLLRFKENDLVKSEYVLVGTFLSFVVAIITGCLVKYVLLP